MTKIMIGLETHVQLNTKTKLFCGCPMDKIAETEENSRCCPICLGMPGSKPRVNKAAIDAAIKVALALKCKISPETFFSRKTYLYPDMSKNFQITQYEIPLAKKGSLETIDAKGKPKKINIERIHIEEDPAKLQHIGGDIQTANYTLIDYNRSGIPLIEIVTEPDFTTAKEVRTFLRRLTAILEYLKVFVPGELSLKSDVNVSIDGGERTEIKNITGVIDVEKALQSEIFRQKNAVKRGEKIVRETRAWLPNRNTTISLRRKEFEEDYGYIFEPDLTMVEISDKWIKDIEKGLPELPHQKFERYQKQFKISPELAFSITDDLDLAQFYEKCAEKQDPKFIATWMNILKKVLHYNDLEIKDTKLTVDIFLRLLDLVKTEKLTDLGGEMVLREIITKPEDFDKIVDKFSKMDLKEVDKIIKEVIKENEKPVKEYKEGKEEALKFLIGQVIRKSERRIDAKTAKELLEKNL